MQRGVKLATVVVALAVGCGSAAAQEVAGPPVPPAGLVASLTLPVRDGTDWATPNRGLSAAETMWHLRIALNVAALNCRGPGEAATVASYNALLSSAKAELAAALDDTTAAYRKRAGAAWQARYDENMTRLYNFWAQPAAHDGFCKAADAVLLESTAIGAGSLNTAAAAALARVEQPFLDFFTAAAQYRTAMVAWNRASMSPVQVAASVPSVQVVAPLPSIPAVAAASSIQVAASSLPVQVVAAFVGPMP